MYFWNLLVYLAWFAVNFPLRMIKELDSVVLTTDLPAHGLAKDDIGTVVPFTKAARAAWWNS